MKYLRLIFTDPIFIVRWSMLAVICAIIAYQYRTLDFQDNHVAQMLAARQERQRLATLRRELAPKPEPGADCDGSQAAEDIYVGRGQPAV